MDGVPGDGSIDLLAFWWLPGEALEAQVRKTPGRLTWSPQKGGRLQLLGELIAPETYENHSSGGRRQVLRSPSSRRNGTYDVILGEYTTERGHKSPITLLRSFSLNKIAFASAHVEYPERIAPGAVITGAWYSSSRELEAETATFDMTQLTHWIDRSGIAVRYPKDLDDDPECHDVVACFDHLPDLTTQIGNTQVSIRHDLGLARGTADHHLDDRWTLRCGTTGHMGDLERFLEIAVDMRALVTIGVGQTANIRRAIVHHPKVQRRTPDGALVGRADIEYMTRWAHVGEEPSGPLDKPYFGFEEFGGSETIGRWLTTAKRYSTMLRRVMATRYTDTMYLEDQIINVCAALERFDKVRRPNAVQCGKDGTPLLSKDGKTIKPSFRKRIEACVDLAEPFFMSALLGDKDDERAQVDAWTEQVRRVRNELAHHDRSFLVTGETGSAAMYEQLYWLFVMCLLRECGAPTSTFEAIQQHPTIAWIREQASASS